MLLPLVACAAIAGIPSAPAQPGPKMIAYSARPGPYLTEHAADVAKIYDGLFFVVGSWDDGIVRDLGMPGEPPSDPAWRRQVSANVAVLRKAGATENLLGVSFNEDAAWPSAETLLSADYTAKMARHFRAFGEAAKDMGFRGVSIDVEYPYKRYAVDNKIYTYQGYTVDDLLNAAKRQGRACMSAVLDAFPDAVVWVLPGDLSGPPIGRAFMLGLLNAMAERDAPGGYHLGAEWSYGMYDPASQAGIPRFGDCRADELLHGRDLAYWKRRCSVAPGVWPLHMVETGGPDYPVRPWPEELTELRQQLQTLRALAKRYVWSFSGFPVWGSTTVADMERYGFGKPSFPDAEEAIGGWQQVLRDRSAPTDPRILRLVRSVHDYDAGKIDAEGLCDRFGTPGDWLLLGPLGNPNVQPQYLPLSAVDGPKEPGEMYHGRDDVVRWFKFRNVDPVGSIRLRYAFDYRNTDELTVYAVCDVIARKETHGYVWLAWDDGAVVRVNGKVVLDRAKYPKRGHGLLYRDRYLFEASAPITLPKGRSRLSVTSINDGGSWGVNLRLADKDLFPLQGLRFELPKDR